MKKYIIYSLVILGVLTSCTKKELTPIVKLGPAASISNPASGSSFTLAEDAQDEVMSVFSWSAADFGFQAGVDYDLQMDKAGNNFADVISLGVVNSLSIEDITEGQMNAILLTKGLPDGVAAALELRVVATVSPDVAPLISDVVSINVTPYKSVILYPQLQVPGSYQGWNPADSTTAVYSLKSDKNFEGYIYFATGNTEFKFTDGPSWDTNWGDDGADGTLDPGGSNIIAVDAGVYKLNVNLNDLTYTSAKTDWGLIGSATPGGWDSDQDMIHDAASGTLKITLDLVAGDIKFRANDAWDLNLGDTDANKSLEYGGDNIVIEEAGNYTVELIINVAEYTYNITKN